MRCLDQLGDYLEREIDTAHKVKSALAYPLVVLGLAVVVSVVLVVYVLPKFRSFFKSLNAKLPLPTRMLLAIADFMGQWGLYLVALIAALLVAGVLPHEHGAGARRFGISLSSRSPLSAD